MIIRKWISGDKARRPDDMNFFINNTNYFFIIISDHAPKSVAVHTDDGDHTISHGVRVGGIVVC